MYNSSEALDFSDLPDFSSFACNLKEESMPALLKVACYIRVSSDSFDQENSYEERRIIHPTLSITKATAYSDIVRTAVTLNAIQQDYRRIPRLSLGDISGACWEQTVTLQISYANLMEWVYTICEKIGGTANIRLVKNTGEQYRMVFDLYEGSDRSIMQQDNPHIIFSDTYSNLLSFSYAEDASVERNLAYIFGQGKGDERKRTTQSVS